MTVEEVILARDTARRYWQSNQERLTQIEKSLIKMCEQSSSRDYVHGMKVSAATLRIRADELDPQKGGAE